MSGVGLISLLSLRVKEIAGELVRFKDDFRYRFDRLGFEYI